MVGLFGVQSEKQLLGRFDECALWHVSLNCRRHSTKNLHGRLVLVGFRQCIERFQELLHGSIHVVRLPPSIGQTLLHHPRIPGFEQLIEIAFALFGDGGFDLGVDGFVVARLLDVAQDAHGFGELGMAEAGQEEGQA